MSLAIARTIAIIRILIGVGFVAVGIAMLMDQDLLFGGLMRHVYSTGGPVRIYRDIFLRVVEPRETMFVYFGSFASIVLGLLYLSGTLISLTSLAASFLVVNYGLAGSAWNRPRQLAFFLAAVLLLMMGRMGAGCIWGVDGWLIQRIKDRLVLFPLRRRAPEITIVKQTSRRVAQTEL